MVDLLMGASADMDLLLHSTLLSLPPPTHTLLKCLFCSPSLGILQSWLSRPCKTIILLFLIPMTLPWLLHVSCSPYSQWDFQAFVRLPIGPAFLFRHSSKTALGAIFRLRLLLFKGMLLSSSSLQVNMKGYGEVGIRGAENPPHSL